MQIFSTDANILKYEGVLFSELYFPWQILQKGDDGVLNGTSFSSQSADFISTSGVAAGGVIYLQTDDGVLQGAFEIVSVNSATELTVSVLRADSDDIAIAIGSASGISYRISSFVPQANEVMFELTQYFGIRPGNPDSDYGIENIVDASVLRQASVYAVMASVYATLGGRLADDGYWKKSMHYKKLFERARERMRLSFDAGSEGGGVIKTIGSSVRIVRE
jgi:hypothetical protein